jgi:hypothetical protein
MKSLSVGLGKKRIDIVERGQISRAGLLHNEVSAHRFCFFDDAFDDVIPARRVDDV